MSDEMTTPRDAIWRTFLNRESICAALKSWQISPSLSACPSPRTKDSFALAQNFQQRKTLYQRNTPKTIPRNRTKVHRACMPTLDVTSNHIDETDTSPIPSEISFYIADGNSLSDTIETIRQRKRKQLKQLGIATILTFFLNIYLLCSIPPTPVAVSMILFGSLTLALGYQLAKIVRTEVRSMIEGRGIGDYLPSKLYDLLYSTSLHDLLSNHGGECKIQQEQQQKKQQQRQHQQHHCKTKNFLRLKARRNHRQTILE